MGKKFQISIFPFAVLLAGFLVFAPGSEAQRGNVPVVPIPATGGIAYFANGSSSTPSVSFVGSKFDGFWWKSLGHVIYSAQGNPALDFSTGILTGAAYTIGWNNVNNVTTGALPDISFVRGGAAGQLVLDGGSTIGARFKVESLPTISSGFGTSPSIVAGSTALAGAVNVGTGGVATTGVINFNGTAWGTAAPFCTPVPSLTNVPTRPTTISTTQLTLTTTTAWTASDIVYWTCIGTK